MTMNYEKGLNRRVSVATKWKKNENGQEENITRQKTWSGQFGANREDKREFGRKEKEKHEF